MACRRLVTSRLLSRSMLKTTLLPSVTVTPSQPLRNHSTPAGIPSNSIFASLFAEQQRRFAQQLFDRRFSSASAADDAPIAEVTYEYVRELVKSASPNSCIIDVRNPNELVEQGDIPTAVNVPLKDLQEALSQPPEVLKRRLGISSEEDEIIFSCVMGLRSAKAVHVAQSLGFTNGKNFVGGHQEWKEREKESS